METVANRRVVQIEPRRDSLAGGVERILDYLNRELIILLGDPGAGKTHCFGTMAASEGVPVCSVAQFIARDGGGNPTTVYLDGLDEYRPLSITRDSNPAIKLLQTLRKSGHPRLRLSCRFADWLGTTDLEIFKDYCDSSTYVVLALEPLSHQEACEVLTNKTIEQPEKFLAKAAARHLDWMVSNPQNLLMLAEVVAKSGWPSTKRELYEQSSRNHLAETKRHLHGSPLGHHPPAELLDPAGAACAALLISGAPGIARSAYFDGNLPTYSSVPFSQAELVLAALGRRAFTSVPETEAVTCVHRTLAEYLGARWLGKSVAEGLPLSRIQALLGADFRPSPSLRGLHAWLPHFVPLHASVLISSDPIGILTYGDAASLSPSNKSDLIKALGGLAAENAWFLTEGLSEYGLAGLSCPETAEQLLAILRSEADPVSLKTVVLQAISNGEKLVCYRQELERILAGDSAPLRHRRLVFKSLLNYGPDGVAAVVRIYVDVLARDPQAIGLRSESWAASMASRLGPPMRSRSWKTLRQGLARGSSAIYGRWTMEYLLTAF